MEKKPLISIIVPVYNAGQYLSRCIDSLLIQDIYELILVNDGSTDNSREICDKYGAHDERIRVFHCENNGVSVARNIGISNAQGDWIAFVDADDWVEPNWISSLAEEKLEDSTDIVIFGLQKVKNHKVISKESPALKQVLSCEDFISSGFYNFSACAYLFKKSIIDKYNIQFPEGLKFSEDQAFILKYISVSRNIQLIDKMLYNYYIHESSTVGKNITTFGWAISNISVANDFLRFCLQYGVPKSFYDKQIRKLYDAFLMYYNMVQIKNYIKDQQLYLIEYKETLKLYPDFKSQTTFRLASYYLMLPRILEFRKKIKKLLFRKSL